MIPFRSPVPRFAPGGDVFIGDGALTALRALAGTRVALVLSPSIARDLEFVPHLERAAAAPQVVHHRWSGGEPTVAAVAMLAAALRAQRPDVIVAVGGGSVIDAARAAWLQYEHPSIDLERSPGRVAIPPLRGLARFAAVPTTAGAGAEVSSAVVLSDLEGRKLVLVSGEFLPDLVVLDPRASAGVPNAIFRRSLCDVLGHLVEGHCSRVANPFVAELARQLLPPLWQGMSRGVGGGYPDAAAERLRMMQWAMQGGWIQNHRPPGLGHAVAHALARLDVPHAEAVGRCLGPSLRENLGHAPVRAALDELARSIGLRQAEELIEGIEGHMTTILGPLGPLAGRLSTEASTLVETALSDVTARTNPIPLRAEMVERVLASIR